MNIVRFKDGDRLDASALNAPIAQIEKAITALELTQENIKNYSYLSYKEGVCREDVAVGDIVYYDEDGFIARALATYSSTFADDGGLLANSSAYPIGIVSAKTGTLATVITEGIIPSSLDLVKYITNNSDSIGEYYLSSSRPGKLTKDKTQAIPIKVLTISADKGICINISQPPTNYHKHTYLKLTGWSATISNDLKKDLPEGFVAKWVYVGGTTDEYNKANYILSNFGATYVFVQNGMIKVDAPFVVVNNRIFCSSETVGTVLLFVNLPCVADQPIVRAVTTSNPRLSVTSKDGVVTLGLDDYKQVEEESPSGSAISEFGTDGTFKKTPIVSDIVTDSTLTAQRMANGVFALSALGSKRVVYPDMVSLDLALTTVVDNRILYVFPAGISSGVLGRVSLPAPPAGLSYKLTPFVEPIGVTGNFNFNADISVECVSTGTEGGIASNGVLGTTSLSTNVENNKVYFCEADVAIEHRNTVVIDGAGVVPGATVFIKVATANTMAASQYFINFGVIVEVVE